MATPNQIVVDSSTNVVDIQTNDNQLYITSNVPNTEITVTQPVTSVIQVATIGPKGDKGDKGDTSNQIATGSVTASVNVGSDTFKVVSGSSTFLYISSSGRIGIGTTNPALGLLQLNTNNENPHANLVINAGVGRTSSITVRADNGFNSPTQKTYNPIGGSDSLNFIQLLDTDTTTIANQPIGRIIFTSNDGDTNEFTTKAFIEAVSEDATPDSFLAFGTNQSGSNTTERLRINSIGNVGIGTTTPKATLDVAGTVVQGQGTNATNLFARAYGLNTTASGQYSNAEGGLSQALGTFTHAEGQGTIALGTTSHAEGINTIASGSGAHAEGGNTIARGNGSHAEGSGTLADGLNSHAEGIDTLASGEASHAEGTETVASGDYSHAEGASSISSGAASHAEGSSTLSSGYSSHAEGISTIASGAYSHAEGSGTLALGIASHAEGLGTITQGDYQLTIGQYNISSSAQSAFIIGNGIDDSNRSNLLFASGSEIQIIGSLNINGDIAITGTASINTLVVNQTQLSTGSNQLGDTANDTQTLYGSVIIPTGSLTVTGSATITDLLNSPNISTTSITASTIGGLIAGQFTPYIRYNTNNIVASSSFGHTTAYMLSELGGFSGTNDISFYAGAVTQPEIMRIVGSTGFVGIGESSPSAKLEIRGSGTTSATTAFRVENANASASLVVRDDGNVGIGTTSPSVRLHISGTSATNELVYLTGDASQGSAIRFNRGSSYSWRMGVVPNSNFTIEDVSYSTVRFQINNTSGLIGINTTSPNARLHISGANNEALLIASSSTAPSALFVSGSGNVGIGTTTPTRTLYVSSSVWDNTSGAGVVIENSNTVGSGLTLKPSNSVVTNGSNGWAIYAGGPDAGVGDGNLGFWAHGTNQARLVIQRAGNVGIGTTTPQRRLHIDASGSANTDIPLLLTSVDANNRVGIRFASSSLSAGRQHSLFNRVSTPTAEWLLGTNAGETAQWNFIPRDDTNYAITLRTPFNGGTAQITTGLSQSLFSLGAGGTANQHLNISSSGNVGIGTTTPSTTLQVAGTSSLQNIIFDTHNTYDIGTITTRARNIWSNGNVVGVGGVFNNLVTYFTASIGGGALGFTPSANLHVSGANAGALLRVSSPTQTNILFVSGSGNVGIGTGTPGVTLDVVDSIRASNTMFNTVTQTRQITINSANQIQFFSASVETARYDNNGWGFFNTAPAAKVHISGANADALFRVSSPSAANALFVSGSGRVGIGTGTPRAALHVSAGDISLDGARYLDWANGDNRIIGGSAGGYSLQFHTWTGAALTEKMRISGSGEVGIGVTNMTANLHVSGASNSNLLRVSSPTQTNILFVSGSGNVGIGTSTPTLATLQIQGNVSASSYTGSLLGTASLATNVTNQNFAIAYAIALG